VKRHDDVYADLPSSMTRVCRAKFERDDLDEAMIICGLKDSQPRDVEAQSPSSYERKIGNSGTGQGPVKQTPISATWRVPRLFPFNYTMSPPRARSNAQRCSIPFENTGVHYAPVRVESPEATDYRATVLAHTTESNNDKSGSLVSLRPPHPRWNDESDPDHPYDNPYYSRPIRDTLWLPRNPCGLLDLDDTIELSEALTSSESSGDLGSWIVGSRSLASDFQSSAPLEHSPEILARVPEETLAATMPPRYSDNEGIGFPPLSASGVHGSNDHEVSRPERHSSIHKLRGYNCHNRSQTTPTTASWPPINSFHSEERPVFDPSTRSASLPIVGRSQSSTSRDPELAEIAGKLPGVNASVELLTSSQRRPRDHMAEPSIESLAEAVTREAMAEERKVMDERMKKEEAEAEDNATTRNRPWWMGFFFSRAAT
jgi:hypothetical protein